GAAPAAAAGGDGAVGRAHRTPRGRRPRRGLEPPGSAPHRGGLLRPGSLRPDPAGSGLPTCLSLLNRAPLASTHPLLNKAPLASTHPLLNRAPLIRLKPLQGRPAQAQR